MSAHYPVLTFLTVVLKILGALLFLFGIGAVLMSIAQASDVYRPDPSLNVFLNPVNGVGAIGSAVMVFAYAELISVAMAIEKNTRLTAERLAKGSAE